MDSKKTNNFIVPPNSICIADKNETIIICNDGGESTAYVFQGTGENIDLNNPVKYKAKNCSYFWYQIINSIKTNATNLFNIKQKS